VPKKLKPCPLCGGGASLLPHGVSCNNCSLWLGGGTRAIDRFHVISGNKKDVPHNYVAAVWNERVIEKQAEIKCNFNELRRRIASAYNKLVACQDDIDEQQAALCELQVWLGTLMELHNPDDPHDSDDLSDEVKLLHAGEPQEFLGT